jgi:hypothetical protein
MADDLAFEPTEIPEFHGPGPKGGYLPIYAARQELWRYSLSLIDDPSRSWCEFGVAEGETLEWFAARKPRGNRLFGFDSFEGIPEPWLVYPAGHWRTRVYRSNRPDVVVVPGRFEASLTRDVLDAIGPIGLLHVDCDLYASTRTVLERVAPLLREGTVIVFDEFYHYAGWEQHESKAFFEVASREGFQFEYLGRTPTCQISLRITGRGAQARSRVRPCAWAVTGPGIGIRLES